MSRIHNVNHHCTRKNLVAKENICCETVCYWRTVSLYIVVGKNKSKWNVCSGLLYDAVSIWFYNVEW
jgi:hypothetical protein